MIKKNHSDNLQELCSRLQYNLMQTSFFTTAKIRCGDFGTNKPPYIEYRLNETAPNKRFIEFKEHIIKILQTNLPQIQGTQPDYHPQSKLYKESLILNPWGIIDSETKFKERILILMNQELEEYLTMGFYS